MHVLLFALESNNIRQHLAQCEVYLQFVCCICVIKKITQHSQGASALHNAIKRGRVEVVRILLDRGTEIDEASMVVICCYCFR